MRPDGCPPGCEDAGRAAVRGVDLPASVASNRKKMVSTRIYKVTFPLRRTWAASFMRIFRALFPQGPTHTRGAPLSPLTLPPSHLVFVRPRDLVLLYHCAALQPGWQYSVTTHHSASAHPATSRGNKCESKFFLPSPRPRALLSMELHVTTVIALPSS